MIPHVRFTLGRLRLRQDLHLFVLTAIIVILSRLPFLSAGYGTDPDAWRVVLAARQISSTGQYTASRLPGYPLQEMTAALLWPGGPLVLNGTTALLSACGVAFFVLSLKRLGIRNYFLGGLALAFTPLFYIYSTHSIDYCWALSFILASFYFALIQKPLVAGIMLGLAAACRVTSFSVMIPLGFLIFAETPSPARWSHLLKHVMSANLVSIAFYTPVVLRYRSSFFTVFITLSKWPRPSILYALRNGSLPVWGTIGLLAIGGTIVYQLCRWAVRRPILVDRLQGMRPLPAEMVTSTLIVVFYTFLFIKLPVEAGYIMPALPFIILLLAKLLERNAFVFLCQALILSSFLLSVNFFNPETSAYSLPTQSIVGHSFKQKIGGRTILVSWLGPIFVDHLERNDRIVYAEHIERAGRATPANSVIIAGPWLPMVQVALPRGSEEAKKYLYLLTAEELQDYVRRGSQVFYVPGEEDYNFQVYRVDLRASGALSLFDFEH